MKRKIVSMLTMLPVVCMMVSMCVVAADISVQKASSADVTDQSINEIGTFHDKICNNLQKIL